MINLQNKKHIIIIFLIVVAVAALLGILFGKLFSFKSTDSSINPIDTLHIEKAKQNVVILKESLAKDPQNTEIQRSLSRAFLISGDVSGAQQYIIEAIKQNNMVPQYYVDLGNIYFTQNDIMRAEEQFKKAIEVFHQINNPSQANLPAGISEDNLPPEVKNRSRQGLASVPTVAYMRLADIYLRQNKISEAYVLLKEGILLTPQYPDFYLLLSQACERLHNSSDALKYHQMFEQLTSFQKRG